MFAFAAWDRRERSLHLVRDRLGEKPLYYGSIDGVFAFASELKGLRAHPKFASPSVSRDALALYVRYSYIPAPHSIYERVAIASYGREIAPQEKERAPERQGEIWKRLMLALLVLVVLETVLAWRFGAWKS